VPHAGAAHPRRGQPRGDFYTFGKGVSKTGAGGGKGFADVWYRGHFAFEYKGKHKDLGAAYDQLLLYREDLENPPLLVVSDMDRFEVHTNFTGTVKRVHAFADAELPREENLRVLRALFTDPDGWVFRVSVRLYPQAGDPVHRPRTEGRRLPYVRTEHR